MDNLIVDYNQLRLKKYEGAGNIVSVVDVSQVVSPGLSIANIRAILETDPNFRSWLQSEGRKQLADSVMLYFPDLSGDCDYISFVGEPNAATSSKFSTMCGNGLRCLAFHLARATNRRRFSILAGERREVEIKDRRDDEAWVTVDLGPFNNEEFTLGKYADFAYFDSEQLLNRFGLRRTSVVGIGLNGKEEGEPHLVVLLKPATFLLCTEQLGIETDLHDNKMLLEGLRSLASLWGSQVTFDTQVFPQGINFNIGLIKGNEIFVATHERNLSASLNECRNSVNERGHCRCMTKACGTGGAAVANMAGKNFKLGSSIKTIHSGGVIYYDLRKNSTLMTGQTRKI